MLFPVALIIAALSGEPQAQSPGAAEAVRPNPDTSATTLPGVTATGVSAPTAPVPPPQICRTERVTGSNLSRRVCRNRAQTEAERAESREMLRRVQGSRVPPAG